ncbi:MAG: alpha/beta fold hydrolase [Bryobacteraceae bacterium]|jgi:pimeloyl-ACP methyl ester carboxylesterase
MSEATQKLAAVAAPEVRLGNGRFFANQTFHFEALRALGYTQAGGADAGEVLETVGLITEGDVQSWYAQWSATADRVVAMAEGILDPIGKSGALMRAHNYQRTAEFLLPPDDPKRPSSWEKTKAYFYQALDACGSRYERITLPYEGGNLRGLYWPGPGGAGRKPLIVAVGGFDSILEELYLVFGKAALDRGYSFLAYEGPGQGEPLRRYGLTFTPEWERPTRAVMDEFLRTHPEPGKIALIGMSMGGYLAARAAAFDERFDGLVSFDTCFDLGEVARRMLGLADDPVLSKSPDFVWSYNNARWTMGTKTVEETRAAFVPYTLAPVAGRIRQDVLILAGTEDHFIPAHQTADLQGALVNARSVTLRIFDRASGGAEHCQAGNLSLVHAATFNWLLSTFGV